MVTDTDGVGIMRRSSCARSFVQWMKSVRRPVLAERAEKILLLIVSRPQGPYKDQKTIDFLTIHGVTTLSSLQTVIFKIVSCRKTYCKLISALYTHLKAFNKAEPLGINHQICLIYTSLFSRDEQRSGF